MVRYLVVVLCLCAPIKAPVMEPLVKCDKIIYLTKKAFEAELVIDTVCDFQDTEGVYVVTRKKGITYYPKEYFKIEPK